MIPTVVLAHARAGFGLARGSVRVLSTRFGKVCLAHRDRDGTRTQLRLVRAHSDTIERLEAETAWLQHLSTNHHLAVPVAMRWKDAAFVSPVLTDPDGHPWHAIACSWVPGRHINRGLRANDFRRAGALLARLHLANQDASPAIAAARPVWGIPRLFELATTLRDLIHDVAPTPATAGHELASALRASYTSLQHAIGDLPRDDDHTGLIHTDAHWQNLRWTRRVLGIVDFEDFATGRYMLDIACLWGKVEGRPGARRMLDAILGGYDGVRTLPRNALRDVRVMLAFRRFDYAGWVLSWPRLDMQRWGPDFLTSSPAYIDRLLAP